MSFYKFYNKHGLVGYHIPIRNSFNHIVEREFIPFEAKKMFDESFGQRIISDEQFIDWYTRNVKNFSE